MTDYPILDETVVRRLETLGGGEFVGEIVGVFVDQAPRRIEAALEGARSNSLETVRRAAHSLVSTAGHLGARRMMRLAEEIECAAGAQNWEAVRRLLPALLPAFAESRAALDRLLSPEAA